MKSWVGVCLDGIGGDVLCLDAHPEGAFGGRDARVVGVDLAPGGADRVDDCEGGCGG